MLAYGQSAYACAFLPVSVGSYDAFDKESHRCGAMKGIIKVKSGVWVSLIGLKYRETSCLWFASLHRKFNSAIFDDQIRSVVILNFDYGIVGKVKSIFPMRSL